MGRHSWVTRQQQLTGPGSVFCVAIETPSMCKSRLRHRPLILRILFIWRMKNQLIHRPLVLKILHIWRFGNHCIWSSLSLQCFENLKSIFLCGVVVPVNSRQHPPFLSCPTQGQDWGVQESCCEISESLCPGYIPYFLYLKWEGPS